MNKAKKMISIVTFIVLMFVYCLLVMVFLAKINFNNWIIELIVYFVLGVAWIFPAMFILRPFKKK